MALAMLMLNETRAFEHVDQSGRIHLRQARHAVLGARTSTGTENPFLARFSIGKGKPSCMRLER